MYNGKQAEYTWKPETMASASTFFLSLSLSRLVASSHFHGLALVLGLQIRSLFLPLILLSLNSVCRELASSRCTVRRTVGSVGGHIYKLHSHVRVRLSGWAALLYPGHWAPNQGTENCKWWPLTPVLHWWCVHLSAALSPFSLPLPHYLR